MGKHLLHYHLTRKKSWMNRRTDNNSTCGKINHLEKKHQQNKLLKREISRNHAHILPLYFSIFHIISFFIKLKMKWQQSWNKKNFLFLKYELKFYYQQLSQFWYCNNFEIAANLIKRKGKKLHILLYEIFWKLDSLDIDVRKGVLGSLTPPPPRLKIWADPPSWKIFEKMTP